MTELMDKLKKEFDAKDLEVLTLAEAECKTYKMRLWPRLAKLLDIDLCVTYVKSRDCYKLTAKGRRRLDELRGVKNCKSVSLCKSLYGRLIWEIKELTEFERTVMLKQVKQMHGLLASFTGRLPDSEGVWEHFEHDCRSLVAVRVIDGDLRVPLQYGSRSVAEYGGLWGKKTNKRLRDE